MTDKKRIRGHVLDKLESLERALESFTNGSQRSKEINQFDKDEIREIEHFYKAVSIQTAKLKKKLLSIYGHKDLTDAQKSRLPESVRRILFPTEEERIQDATGAKIGKAFATCGKGLNG